ncbi:hypothetical protein KC354_g15117 [Hortaea werneckii]|nr:hypothetical protein KC354_g15117 [Hortaea werneckii]
MSAKACAPDDVFNKYCAELSVPRLITTWSIEMSKQQLVDTLSNRGYRFDLNQFSADQLLQLLRESDVLYHQVRKDGIDSKRESITAATVKSGKGKESEQTARHLEYGISGVEAQFKINYNLPTVHSEVRVEDAVSVAREKEHISHGNSDRQAVAESPLADSSSQHAQGERQKGVTGGKRRSNPISDKESESKVEQGKEKKMMTNKEIDPQFKQRVDDVQSRLSALARKLRLENSVWKKIDSTKGEYVQYLEPMKEVLEFVKAGHQKSQDRKATLETYGRKMLAQHEENLEKEKNEIAAVESMLAELQ